VEEGPKSTNRITKDDSKAIDIIRRLYIYNDGEYLYDGKNMSFTPI
jgi:hypothetical protein